MSIQTLNRLTIAGLVSDKEAVLAALQELGCLHLIPLRPAPREPEKEPASHAVETLQALRYLRDVREQRRQVQDPAGFDLDATVRQVLANQRRLREVNDRRDALAERVAELAPWGDFSFPPEAALGGIKLWFYIVPRRQLGQLAALDLPWQEVHRDNRQAWIVVSSQDEPPRDALPVPRTRTGSLGLSEVRRRLEAAEVELEEVQAEHQALTRWIHLIASHLARAEDQARLRHAQAQTHDDEHLFLIQGWAPEAALAAVRELTESRGLALMVEPPAPADAPPTLLANPPALAAGEDLVAFYQMPAYHAWDPAAVLFFSFAAFFAMILSDAGYAGLLGLLLLINWSRLGRRETGRRLRVLGAALVSSALVWGMLVGSYFGFAPPPDSLLGRLHLLDINDLPTMMRLSVGIGVMHLVLGNALLASARGWRHAEGRVALSWIPVLLGGFGLWLTSGPEAAPWMAQTALGLMIAGFLSMLLLGSDRPVAGPTSILLRLLDGARHLLRVTQAFGDVLSDLRPFALGMASASLAITFNGLARSAATEMPGIGILLAILILLIGHALNILLAIVSGVVHGLRLNFIELYNWAMSGEGYAFKPFKRTELRE